MNVSDLPWLFSIAINDDAFYGDCSFARETTFEAPYNYKNTLIMRSVGKRRNERADLPALAELRGGQCIFRFIGSVFLESGGVWHVRL